MQPNDKLDHYHALLQKWQKTINLVSPTTLNNAWERHFEDSIQLSQLIPTSTKNISDIGSGAGFPALVLAILNPKINFTLVESDARKCAFLRTVSRETESQNVTILNERIENIIDDIDADILTSRALASLKQLIIYATPLWENNQNFQMILPKGKNWQSEIDDALKKYAFDYDVKSSKTDDDARILIVNNIVEK